MCMVVLLAYTQFYYCFQCCTGRITPSKGRIQIAGKYVTHIDQTCIINMAGEDAGMENLL